MKLRAAGMLLVGVAIGQPSIAETFSEHNEEQVAYNTAIRIVMERGCVPNFTRSKPYRVDVTAERVTIVAKEVGQDCRVKSTIITWVEPTTRENGSVLYAGDIKGYLLTHNGSVTTMVVGNRFVSDQIKPGDDVTLATVDTDGRTSKPAQAVWK